MAKNRSPRKSAAKTSKVARVNFKYIFPDDYNPQYANGVHGGVTTQGEIALNFFVERHPLPFEETFSLNADGSLGNNLVRSPEVQDGTLMVVRFISSGVILNREAAMRVHEFLGTAIRNLDASIAAKSAKGAVGKVEATDKLID